MQPKSSNYKPAFKSKIKLDLEKLKNGEIQAAKADLTKINIKRIANIIGVLSEGVKLYMYLFTPKGYYASNDRTINLLMGCDIGMSATTSETAEAITDSDKEVVDVISFENNVEPLIVAKNKTSRWIILSIP